MKKRGFFVIIFMFIFTSNVFAVILTDIFYEVDDLGSGRWEYTYDVKNVSLESPIEEFTIWFDYGRYDNLLVTTPDPLAGNWDEIVLQPEPVISDDGLYDALTLALGIGEGEIVSGFSVSFDWLDEGVPGSQYYEIVVPDTSPMEVIDSGWTRPIPEPSTLLLLFVSTLFYLKKNKEVKQNINNIMNYSFNNLNSSCVQ